MRAGSSIPSAPWTRRRSRAPRRGGRGRTRGDGQAQQPRRARAGADARARGSAVDRPRDAGVARAPRVDRRDRPQRVVDRAGLGREDPPRAARDGRAHRGRRVGPARAQGRRVVRAEAELDDDLGVPVGLERQPARRPVARRDQAQSVPAAREVGPRDGGLAARLVDGAPHVGDATRGADHEGRADAQRIRPDEAVAVAAVPRARHQLGARRVRVAREEGAADGVEAGLRVGRVRSRVHRREPAPMREGDGDRVGRPVRDGRRARCRPRRPPPRSASRSRS
ncbi:hypothetical protein ACAD32_00233 [Clavibacter nebraskensis]